MLIGRLFEGPIDIVGDVHGEAQALFQLMERLGYTPDGRHRAGRRLVFLGDLTDRGPDSPAVVECVMKLVNAGVAQCILGNHELNLLLGEVKTGNHWFYGKAEPMGKGLPNFPSAFATAEDRQRYLAFFRTLPIALERDDLRVVHACWNDAALQAMHGLTDSAKACKAQSKQFYERMARSGVTERVKAKWTAIEKRSKDPTPPGPAFDAELARFKTQEQMAVPVKVLTSGEESETDPDNVYWSSGRWRMNNRVPWWNQGQFDRPIVVGHYWRQRQAPTGDAAHPQQDIFAGQPASSWLGDQRMVYCVDFSVGRRYRERTKVPPDEGFTTQLGALRTPEWTVLFDSQDPIVIGPPGRKA